MNIKFCRLLASFILIAITPFIASEGVNCHGSKYCDSVVGWGGGNRDLMLKALQEADDNATFENGKDIACFRGGANNGIDGAICTWVWNTDNTTTGATVKTIAQRIVQHGCKMCGSAPIVEDGSNDVSKGEVTIGWSWDFGGCDGLCNEYGASDYKPGATVPGAGNLPVRRLR